jgi:hemolysin III
VTKWQAQALRYSRGEMIADAAVHAAGILLALVALPILVTLAAVWDGTAPTMTALGIYAASVLAMFGCSGAYNMIRHPQASRILRRFDHAAIYLKIAGTQTPFAVIAWGPATGWVLTGVWVVAIAGVLGKLLAEARWEKLSVALYLLLGWAGVLLIPTFSESLAQPTLVLMLTGGTLYSVGVVFHLWERLPYQNAIWHGFVLTATFVFYAALVVEIARG